MKSLTVPKGSIKHPSQKQKKKKKKTKKKKKKKTNAIVIKLELPFFKNMQLRRFRKI